MCASSFLGSCAVVNNCYFLCNFIFVISAPLDNISFSFFFFWIYAYESVYKYASVP